MKKLDKFDIVFAGVGGQGILTVAGIVARAAVIEGYNVKASELHGLAMRFGAVETHLRFGQKIYSPLVKKNSADLIISLEPLEAVRVGHYAKEDTNFVLDTRKQVPWSVYSEKREYPGIDTIISMLKKVSPKGKVIALDASEIARKSFGSIVVSNVLLLGKAVAEGFVPLKKDSILKAMAQVLPDNVLEMNKKVFEQGFSLK